MDIEVEEMEAKWQSRLMLIAGILFLIAAATHPFVDSWHNPDTARYGVALWVFLGGMNICVSQKIKYEALMKADKKGE